MQTKFTQIREKIEVRVAMLMVVGGTSLLAFIAATGIIVQGPGHP